MRISDWSSDVCSSDVDTTYVGNYALLNVIDDLKRIPGVGDASLLGELDYSMRIWLRPDKMARYGLTTGDVAAAIREQNAQFAAGRFGDEPKDRKSTRLNSSP